MPRSTEQAFGGRLKPNTGRAANYRERAAELREMAACDGDDDQELLELAREYDALAEIADGR